MRDVFHSWEIFTISRLIEMEVWNNKHTHKKYNLLKANAALHHCIFKFNVSFVTHFSLKWNIFNISQERISTYIHLEDANDPFPFLPLKPTLLEWYKGTINWSIFLFSLEWWIYFESFEVSWVCYFPWRGNHFTIRVLFYFCLSAYTVT